MSTRGVTALKDHYDVIVVGAGLSGINAGYRLQTMSPDKDYVILEGRESLGGTWDLFRYPGIRSDSDMYTLGFPFEPWTGEKSIADGADILQYLKDTAAKYRIDERIAYRTRVTAADWSEADTQWTLTLTTPDGPAEVTSDFIYLCSGYYNYEKGFTPDFPGLDSFTGQVIHPQFWPENFDAEGKRVVVIGSGATAMTLVPALAREGAHVTMLQRSPTYVVSLPAKDSLAHTLRSKLGEQRAYEVIRWKNVITSLGMYQFAQRMPKAAASVLTKGVRMQLKGTDIGMEHFTPRYGPWDQRLCVVPDGDLFKALRSGDVDIVTDTITGVEPDGVRVSSGTLLEADVIVTATGLQVQMAGGAQISMNGEPVDLGERFIYRGMMLEGLPNAAVCIGYTNASWTLRSDLSSRYFCMFVNHLTQQGYAYGYPTVSTSMKGSPALDLKSGYIQRSVSVLPKQGDRRPWFLRQNYVLDRRDTKRADVTDDMTFVRASEVRAAAEDQLSRR
ncbi:flavin-containing monooxygenase [Rudaeicoccus suwonensis]|uniref:Cation diffusion facilitator CzcD-associated flavoprotein CzcO n=1 Tax=Rudaeicoccus suwonensis TaxID=657409 RepID=A0A561E3L6_9MICO|nr:NAD(P)/FAD-dependent oxidoreductase [Rudaeicoccus suwonensis]TWE10189.1 cation diffusion facilitator CzcD-associated flavoprotein CzcO [Rudaeicoccus suwonensis]